MCIIVNTMKVFTSRVRLLSQSQSRSQMWGKIHTTKRILLQSDHHQEMIDHFGQSCQSQSDQQQVEQAPAL